MEMEAEPRSKPLAYIIKSASRESPSQKAVHLLEADLRSHWSTGTNTKESILLELDEPCLLSHIRIYNKSVLEWEITAGLKYKPEAFVKVRPRCEAPRRDMIYPTNYTPCKFVRISCLRGNPIAIFFIQLIGVSVPGLEPELQPVINYFVPHIISHKQDTHDLYLQLLQDISSKLNPFLPNLENDLNEDANESTVKFLAMLAGPFYPILKLVIERDGLKPSINNSESDSLKSQSSAPTLLVSSNFELLQPKRKMRIQSLNQPDIKSITFRSDAIIILLKKAFNDKNLGIICRKVAIILQSLVDPILNSENEVVNQVYIGDYSNIFGDEFRVLEGCNDPNYFNLLDISAIEEALLHILYSSASQPQICAKLAENNSEMWSVLPLIQALLPALRPSFNNDQIDENFNQWNQNSVQNALSEIVMMTSAIDYKPLIRACAGYLSSYSLLHAKSACVLIDLCTGPLYPWIPTIIAKVDLTMEVLSDMLSIIQGAKQSINHSKAALKYVMLAISGYMDDLLPQYKEAKQKILFLIEMLDPFLDPIMNPNKNNISFEVFSEKDEKNCEISLSIIRTGVTKPLVLSSLEIQWRQKTVSNSVLLSILDPHMKFPPEMDLYVNISNPNSDQFEETEENSLFAPVELKQLTLTNPKMETLNFPSEKSNSGQIRNPNSQIFSLEDSFSADYYQIKADYLRLINYQDCELRSSEFRQLAVELCNKNESNNEAFNAGIDALLLAAECFVNPFFLVSFKPDSDLLNRINKIKEKFVNGADLLELRKDFMNKKMDFVTVFNLENKRDKTVLDILSQAAKLYNEYNKRDNSNENSKNNEFFIEISETDLNSLDAVTLVRNNQELLCEFIISQFKRENNNSSHEILLQSLLFLLRSATKLYCSPDDVINIIASSASNLNSQLSSFYEKYKSNSFQNVEIEELYSFKRKWNLLQKLITVSSENNYKNLIPFNSWMENINKFSKLNKPLSRFLFWSAISNYIKEYSKERILIISDFGQLSDLLSVFSDEILLNDKSDSFKVLYPDLYLFFPKMSEKFRSFGEKILEAIGSQIKCMPKNYIPDILTWFSEICIWPYSNNNNININAKACLLYILESIVSEHMENIIPEMPHIAHILVSLSKASFADVAFLDSILNLLKPLISYFLQKSRKEEELLSDTSNLQDFELTSFEELFDIIKEKKEGENVKIQMHLIIFILGFIFPDLSFKRKSWILKSLLIWTDFTILDSPNSFYGYLCSFQKLLENCDTILIQNLELFGIKIKNSNSNLNQNSKILRLEEEFGSINEISSDNNDKKRDIENFLVSLDDLINKIIPQIESSWKLHCQLAFKLSQSISHCIFLSRSLDHLILNNKDNNNNILDESNIWLNGFEGLISVILITVKKQYWQVGSIMLDFILNLNNNNKEFYHSFNLNKKEIINGLCSAIKIFCFHAPKISMRLKTEKWISLLFNNKIELNENGSTGVTLSLADLFNTMLNHPEPEQKSIILKQIGKIINENNNNYNNNILRNLVSKIWDEIVKIVLSDNSFLLRKHSMIVLSEILPFLERGKIQSFLKSSDLILGNSGKFLVRISVLLLGNACIYSPGEDTCLIPSSVWSNLENMRDSYTGEISDLEKDLCRALCQLRTESSAKSDLKEVLLSGSVEKPIDPEFVNVRETVLQVLSSLTCVESYFDFFSRNSEEESQELEEAEIELELVQNELSEQNRETNFILSSHKDEIKPNERLEQIKDSIKFLEKSKLEEEIIMRRQKKHLMRQERQKYLEELNHHETELLQELDREKAAEIEKEIERKRQLELERAKTRELQFNLDLEREKLNQREIQRELEQVESGVRPSRRDFSSNSRPRDRDTRYNTSSATDRAEPLAHRSVISTAQSTNPTVILQSRERLDGGYESGEGNSDVEVYGGTGPRRTGGRGGRVGSERRGDRGKWERKH